MGLDLEFYLGYGVEIEPNKEEYFDLREKYGDEYNLRDSIGHVMFIDDAMCGNYACLVYVLDKVEDASEMYDAGLKTIENTELTEDIINQLKIAYNRFTNKELDASEIKLIRVFNCW